MGGEMDDGQREAQRRSEKMWGIPKSIRESRVCNESTLSSNHPKSSNFNPPTASRPESYPWFSSLDARSSDAAKLLLRLMYKSVFFPLVRIGARFSTSSEDNGKIDNMASPFIRSDLTSPAWLWTFLSWIQRRTAGDTQNVNGSRALR